MIESSNPSRNQAHSIHIYSMLRMASDKSELSTAQPLDDRLGNSIIHNGVLHELTVFGVAVKCQFAISELHGLVEKVQGP